MSNVQVLIPSVAFFLVQAVAVEVSVEEEVEIVEVEVLIV